MRTGLLCKGVLVASLAFPSPVRGDTDTPSPTDLPRAAPYIGVGTILTLDRPQGDAGTQCVTVSVEEPLRGDSLPAVIRACCDGPRRCHYEVGCGPSLVVGEQVVFFARSVAGNELEVLDPRRALVQASSWPREWRPWGTYGQFVAFVRSAAAFMKAATAEWNVRRRFWKAALPGRGSLCPKR